MMEKTTIKKRSLDEDNIKNVDVQGQTKHQRMNNLNFLLW